MTSTPFITFEGPEGSGKSTQIRLLAERLRCAGKTVLLTREPGGTHTGEAIRRLVQHESSDAEMGDRTEALLFCASRAQLVAEVIRPALDRGEWVLCDRFTDSTLTYQGYGRGFSIPDLRALNAFATGGLVPDLTILLDIPPEEGFRRLSNRKAVVADRIENAGRGFHERIRQGYHELARTEPGRIRVLLTHGPVDATHEAVWRAVCERFGLPADGASEGPHAR